MARIFMVVNKRVRWAYLKQAIVYSLPRKLDEVSIFKTVALLSKAEDVGVILIEERNLVFFQKGA